MDMVVVFLSNNHNGDDAILHLIVFCLCCVARITLILRQYNAPTSEAKTKQKGDEWIYYMFMFIGQYVHDHHFIL